MDIILHEIPIREIIKDYFDDGEQVIAYGGRLNLRPIFQREFIYNQKESEAVVRTVLNDFPLNVMYWSINENAPNEKGKYEYEILDGQQRSISVCRYAMKEFSIPCGPDSEPMYIQNLTKKERDVFLNYKLMIYFCTGDDKERLEWFKTINIAGQELSDQEMRNALYAGPWTVNAKEYFSKAAALHRRRNEVSQGPEKSPGLSRDRH